MLYFVVVFVLCVVCYVFVFFFKQKTAYEMRISDWSSDVCSSDLAGDAEQVRPIRLPVEGSVRVSVDGIETAAFLITDDGAVSLDAAPGPGIAVRAGFQFDVPVRFAEDRLEASRATFLAGELASVQIGRAHVWTPVNNSHLVCRILLEKKK